MIITKNEQKFLLDWIFKNEHRFLPNEMGKHRKYFILNEAENFPNLFLEIKQRILNKENITEWIPDPFFGDRIMYNETNGYIHEHIDPTLESKNHLRFNLFLSKPFHGGDPIYNGELIPFEERCYLKYLVNEYYHASLPVIGKKPRISISYGILIDRGA
jgi:hypothetical protein